MSASEEQIRLVEAMIMDPIALSYAHRKALDALLREREERPSGMGMGLQGAGCSAIEHKALRARVAELEAQLRAGQDEHERMTAAVKSLTEEKLAAEAQLQAEQQADIAIAAACLCTGVVPAGTAGTVEAVRAVCDRLAAETEARKRAEARVVELEQMNELAVDVGAGLMIDQMEKAATSGGKFSDERANRFVAAEEKLRRLREAWESWEPEVPHSRECLSNHGCECNCGFLRLEDTLLAEAEPADQKVEAPRCPVCGGWCAPDGGHTDPRAVAQPSGEAGER